MDFSKFSELERRTYKITDYLSIMNDVMDTIINETHFMTDEERRYDRRDFYKKDYVDDSLDVRKGNTSYWENIYTISKDMTDMVKDGKIYYNK